MQDSKSDYFSQASKLMLLLPVLILVLFVVIRWGGWDRTPVPSQSVRQAPMPTVYKPQEPTLNLIGPFACDTPFKAGTVSALIKDKNVIATVAASGVVNHLLIRGDCAFAWQEKLKTGTKVCGLTGTINVADSLLSSGLVTLDTLLTSSGSLSVPGLTREEADLFTRSCKSQATIRTADFDLPKGVVFAERTGK